MFFIQRFEEMSETTSENSVPLLDETPIPCINHTFGCKYKGLEQSLHAPNCLHVQVLCPSSYRGVCKWQGNLVSAVSHALPSKCALQLRRPEDVPFCSMIGDFDDPNKSIMKGTTANHWKPVFLLSRTVVRYFLYLITYREGNGRWYLYVCSLAPKELAKNVQVTIKVSEASPVEDEATKATSQVFQFTGNVHSASSKYEDVLETGNYLFLKDEQIQMLKRGKSLFKFSVTVDLQQQMPGNIDGVHLDHNYTRP